MNLSLTGRRAAVAASSAGLGLATAIALAAEGATVAIGGRDRDRLDAAVAAFPAGSEVRAVRSDVSTPEGATAFVDAARSELGGIDILVPNAGGPPAGTFGSTPLGSYLPALEQNLLATVAMCHASVPEMVDRGWGRIVAITSATVREPSPNLILSNTARAGATGFLKTLATEVAPHGVTVNSIQPGLHDTDRLRELYDGDLTALARAIPTRTVGRPEDFGAVVAFLCSDAARFVTGTGIPVDGGASHGLI